jgi:hypothetical protein
LLTAFAGELLLVVEEGAPHPNKNRESAATDSNFDLIILQYLRGICVIKPKNRFPGNHADRA